MTPNPGSDEAMALGCRCGQLDNSHGRGSGYTDSDGAPLFWVDDTCPLHGAVVSRAEGQAMGALAENSEEGRRDDTEK